MYRDMPVYHMSCRQSVSGRPTDDHYPGIIVTRVGWCEIEEDVERTSGVVKAAISTPLAMSTPWMDRVFRTYRT
jgi:hypothetical protein